MRSDYLPQQLPRHGNLVCGKRGDVCCGSACNSLCGLPSWPRSPSGGLAGASFPGDLGPQLNSLTAHQRVMGLCQSPRCSEQGSSGRWICCASPTVIQEKASPMDQEEQGGKRYTVESRRRSFLLSRLLQELWQIGVCCLSVMVLLVLRMSRCIFF